MKRLWMLAALLLPSAPAWAADYCAAIQAANVKGRYVVVEFAGGKRGVEGMLVDATPGALVLEIAASNEGLQPLYDNAGRIINDTKRTRIFVNCAQIATVLITP